MRLARTTDVFGMVDLLVEQHARSIYRDAGEVDRVHARRFLAQAIQRNDGKTEGSTLVAVIDNDAGEIEAFVVGVLARVYHVGNKLCAQDMFLVARDSAPAFAARRLLTAYIEWAQRNPSVYEINLSHTDALPEGDRMGPLYERLGFDRCGGIYRRLKSGAATAARSAA